MNTTSKNPARSRPISANVRRLMRNSRAAPSDPTIIKETRHLTPRDHACCEKQGEIFMEASSMGFSMETFAPLYMTSQLGKAIDFSFRNQVKGEEDLMAEAMKIPFLLESPVLLVESLYWIADICENGEDGVDKCELLTKAWNAEEPIIPKSLLCLPAEPNRDVDALSYAYWLGYLYRSECLLHDESSMMVYSAFPEEIMRGAYRKIQKTRESEKDIAEIAEWICSELDRMLLEKIWPEQEKQKKQLQEKELSRGPSPHKSGQAALEGKKPGKTIDSKDAEGIAADSSTTTSEET